MVEPRKIIILLATYNGAKFLSDQIQSIQGQTVSNWTLLVRDDGSKDNTRGVLETFAAQDKRIRCIADARECLGAVKNFGELMRIACEEEADYVFFSDQDDVWACNKIADQLKNLTEMESRYGQMTPSLAYSDLEVVSQQLERIHPSFMAYQGLAHEPRDPLRVLLTQNFITGCATAINRALLNLAVPLPSEVIMHDWWLALCAAACGRITYQPHTLVRYRQHGKNQIGAEGLVTMMNPLSAASGRRIARSEYYLLGSIRQSALLSERIVSREVPCPGETLRLLKRFAACAQQGCLRRLLTVTQLGLRRQGVLRQLLLYWRLIVSARRAVTD